MNTDVFIDSSGYFAVLNRRDERHGDARKILGQLSAQGRRAITTEYILDETATLLRARGYLTHAAVLLNDLRHSVACKVLHVTTEHFNAAAEMFLKCRDQEFSFTDCTSFVVMRELGLQDALSKDADFRVAGFHPLLA
jgi:uncharacterized protein